MIEINLEVFKYRVFLITSEKDYKYIDKYYKEKDYIDKKDKGWAGMVVRDGYRGYIVLREVSYSVLAHEILHVVKDIVNKRGIEDEETECYLVEYITKILTKKCKKLK